MPHVPLWARDNSEQEDTAPALLEPTVPLQVLEDITLSWASVPRHMLPHLPLVLAYQSHKLTGPADGWLGVPEQVISPL